MLECRNLSFSYNQKNIFEKVNLNVKKGQMISIVGPNGIGKSTLVKCLCNVYRPDNGLIYLKGRRINDLHRNELAKVLGYVPQEQKSNFSMTVYEMVLLGRRPYINWKVRKEDEAVVEYLLQKLNILHLAERDISTLSGGEKQKAAMARALAQEVEILFLDEPTASLDISHQIEVLRILKKLCSEEGTAVVTVLHDLNLAGRFSDRVFLMGRDNFHEFGLPADVFTAENIRAIYGIDVEIIKTKGGNYIIPLSENVG